MTMLMTHCKHPGPGSGVFRALDPGTGPDPGARVFAVHMSMANLV